MNDVTPAADHPATPRRDGWSGARKVAFLEQFIELGVASRALAAVGKGMSGLYALRARDPAFAAAWDAARLMVREKLLDTLVGEAFEGEVHVVTKDEGEIRHRKRNYRLGMGMLDRLNAFEGVELAPVFARHFEDVCEMIADDADNREWRNWLNFVDPKVELFESRALFPLPEESEDYEPDFAVWDDWHGPWTNMPPPPGFAGREIGTFGDNIYQRKLTEDETERHLARTAGEQSAEEADLADKLFRGRAAWEAHFGDGDAASPEGEAVMEYKSMDAPRAQPARNIFSSGRPRASSSISLSSTRISRISGSSMVSIRTPQIVPVTADRAGFIAGAEAKKVSKSVPASISA